MTDPQVNFFISRRGEATEIAKEVAEVLHEAGYTTKLQDLDITTADNFISAMDDMLVNCRHCIAILTKDYASSTYTREEWTNFFKIEKNSKGTRRLIPLRVEEFEPEGLLAAKVYADLVGITDPGQRRQIILAAAEGKATRLRRTAKPFRGVPPRNPDFTGRSPLFEQLQELFQPRDLQAGVHQVAIHGLGGVGKTSIAAEYARRHKDDYAGVWWAPAESRTVLLGSLAEFAALLDPRLAGDKDTEQSVKVGFEKLSESPEPWLLIYDNVRAPEDISGLVPHAGARLLITTRWTEWSGYAEELPLDVMDEATAVDFLLKQTGRPDRDGSARLALALGYLPLALRQAGAYVKLTGMSFDRYAQRCGELIARAPWGTVRQPSVRGTFTMAIERATAECAATESLLAFISVLAPERIPLDLVDDTVLGEDERSEAVMALSAVSLVGHDTFADGTAAIFIHRLVRDAMIWHLEQAQRLPTTLAAAVVRLAAAFPNDGYMEPKSGPRCRQLLPHALTVCHTALETRSESAELGRLLDAAANYLNGQSEYATAEPLYRQAIAIGERVLSPNHASIGEWKNNLGNLLLNTGRNRDAEIIYREAINIGVMTLGRKTPQVATRINNLGVVLTRSGHFRLAEELFREAIGVSEAAFGRNDPRVAARINNLAVVLAKTDRVAEAEALHREAIAIGCATLGGDHRRVTYWRTELANTLRDAHRYEEAERIYREALKRLFEAHGETHLSLGHARDELSRLLLATGRLEEARQEATQALAIRERSLGADHEWTRETAERLGEALTALGRTAEAAQIRARYRPEQREIAAG
jgi:tetratricopeptide (TPR) repeat protein